MNIEQIKSLDQNDFVTNNSKVWTAIEKLSINDLNTLLKENYEIWGDEEINGGIREILLENSLELLSGHIKVLYQNNKIAFDFLIDNGVKLGELIGEKD